MDEGLLNDLLECSVCLERLDTSSRVLPCQHTFCLKCLKVIVESHKELRCPECRVLVEVKVEELPPNVLLMRILEGMRNSAPRKLAGSQRAKSGHSQTSSLALQSRGDKQQVPPHARAMYDYNSKEPQDLSFKKGETIILQKKLDTFWYQGECSGRTGMFPITFVQVVVPLAVPPALCKALYDFRMSAPDEEGCLAFDKGAIIAVHRRVDENWAEGRLEQRVGIFPIAFVELNLPARQLMNSAPLNRPVPPLPESTRATHSDHRHHAQHSLRHQPMSMSTPATAQSNYQGISSMSQSHPNYHAQLVPQLVPQGSILVPTPAQHGTIGGLVTTTAIPRNIMEPNSKLDLIHFNMHKTTMGIQSVPRIGENYDRLRTVKFDYNTPVETTYQNVRTEHFPTNFTNNVSSDSSSSMNTPSIGVSSTTTPNTSSNTSTCESAEPSLPSSPDNNTNNTERNTTLITTEEEPTVENLDASLNTSMGVLSLNESSTATNTSLNVSLPPAESPKNAVPNTSQNAEADTSEARLDVPSSSKALRSSGPDSLLNFGIGLQAALSPSHGKDGYMARGHRDHHHQKRHSLTPSSHLQANHSTQNRHSAEILATSLLDHTPERDRSRDRHERSERSERTHERSERTHERASERNLELAAERTERALERRRRRSRSSERPLPAAYVALYAYKPQKPDELELKKGGVYTVTERCRDGWFKGIAERGGGVRAGVFPGNYVAPAGNGASTRSKHDKPSQPSTGQPAKATPSPSLAAPAATAAPSPAPDAPPRAPSPNHVWVPSDDESRRSRSRSRTCTPEHRYTKWRKSLRRAAPETIDVVGAQTYTREGQPMSFPWSCSSQMQSIQTTPRSDKSKEKSKAEKSSISSGVSLMKRLAAMKKCKSPPPSHAYSMDNPVFEDGPGVPMGSGGQSPGPSLLGNSSHPVHVRSGSCPSQLLRALPASERIRHKERPSILPEHRHAHSRATTAENPWQTQHRKSQSLDVTTTRRDKHHTQPVKERFRCIVPYPPNSEYELELRVDDIVFVSKKRGDGWYKGTLQRTGRTGLFPASFVQSCPHD